MLAMLLCASAGRAQDAPTFRPRQVVFSGGGGFAGSHPIGDVTVTIPRNAMGAPGPVTLLRAESVLGRASALEARVAVALTRGFAIEVAGSFARPQLGVTVSQDPELSGGAFASERVDQYAVDVSGVYQVPVSLGRRARPYAFGGAGYLRQLHEGRLLVETGQTIHGGAGLQYWLLGGNRSGRTLGVRGEARYIRRTGGIDFDDRARGFPAASVLVFFGL